jgi:cell division protein FtsZ
VNEASTIIQSAAHEDANIIFGAVLDEKMKDGLKITVIATGFKDEHPHRSERAMGAAVGAISGMRIQQRPAPEPVTVSAHTNPIVEELEPVGVSVSAASPAMTSHVATPARDSMSLDAVRNSVNGIDGDDLDVPAFMRKRTDTQMM